ncbi:polysaccharide biosynthesis tyrosine autokinase [soil metagenome]
MKMSEALEPEVGSAASGSDLRLTETRLKREDLAGVHQHQLLDPSHLGSSMSAELVCEVQPDHPLADAVYRIRAALLLAHRNKSGPLTISIVGAERGEGRSILAANLAIAFSQLHSRTLLVDADARFGRMHTLFGLPNTGGLARNLAGRGDLEEGAPAVVRNTLAVLTAGFAANAQELISPMRFGAMMKRLALKNDVIIVDTPAWSVGPDAQLIAAETDVALLVTRLHTASRARLNDLVRALSSAGASVLAVPFD